MSKDGDGFQVSMFDSLPEFAPPEPVKKGKRARGEDGAQEQADEPRTRSRKRAVPVTALASEEAFTLENFLPYRLLDVAQGISRRMAHVLSEEWDISLAEWQVLASLARDGAVSVREVEPRTLLDTVAVSRAAKRLTDRKMIKREVNKQDKRLVVLKTTKKGRDIAADIGQCVMEMEADFLKGMNVQDRIRLAQLLKSLS